jgi:hypothetical protein
MMNIGGKKGSQNKIGGRQNTRPNRQRKYVKKPTLKKTKKMVGQIRE